jgi:PAS domain S-box-containing protein/putative nucleotidyltransferase with HDIG domain
MMHKGILQIEELRLVTRPYLQFTTIALLILGLLGGWAGANWLIVLIIFAVLISTILWMGYQMQLHGAKPFYIYTSAMINLLATATIVIITGGAHSPFWLLFLIGAITSAMSFRGRTRVNLERLNAGTAALVLIGPELMDWPVDWGSATLAAMQVLTLSMSSGMIRRITTIILESEEALLESEKRYRILIDSARDVIFTLAQDGKFTSINSSFERFTGWSRAEWLGRPFDGLVAEEDRPFALNLFNHVLEGETMRAMRLRVHTHAGEPLVVEVNLSPQIKDGQVIGLLGIARDMTEEQSTEDALRESEQKHRAMYATAERQTRELALLDKVRTAISQEVNLSTLFQTVVESIVEMFGYTQVSIYLLEGETLVLQYEMGYEYVLEKILVTQGVMGRVVRTGKPVLIEDIHSDADFLGAIEGIASEVCVPLRDKGQVVGTLNVESTHGVTLSEADLNLMIVLSEHIGIAIGRARLYSDIQRHNRILSALQESTLQLIEQLELSEVLQIIIVQAAELMNTTHGYIYLVNQDETALQMILGVGASSESIGIKLAPNEGLAGKVWQLRQPLNVQDYQAWTGSSAQFIDPAFHAVIGVPLISDSRVVGVLGLAHLDPDRKFSNDDVELLSRFAQLASIALKNGRLYTQAQQELAERKQAEETLQESELRFRVLVERLPVVVYTAELGVNGVWSYVSPPIEILLGFMPEDWISDPGLWYRQIHPDDREQQIALEEQAYVRHEPFESEYRMFTRDGRMVWIRDQATPLYHSEGHPLLWQGLMIDITESKRAEERINRQLEKLKALRTIDTTITSSTDIHVTLQTILKQAIAQLQVDAADILLLNPTTHTLEYHNGIGFYTKGVERSSIHIGEGYAGKAILERRMIAIQNLRNQAANFPRHRFVDEENFVCYCGIPLIIKGEAKGVLEVFHRQPVEMNQEWTDFLEALAGQAALAIDNSTLFESLQRSHMELSLAYETTLEGWSAALDLRDKETEGHTQRVTNLTMQLAEQMGLKDKELMQIRRGALLHDIGKMGVPDRILLKPDTLTDEEWEIMRRHPAYAYELLSRIEYLRPALGIPYCHHEKWNGTGYPQGLKGEEIPLDARIFAVVDVYDAITSDRPYRPAWTKERALKYLRALSGIDFDPQVVEAFLKMLDQG